MLLKMPIATLYVNVHVSIYNDAKSDNSVSSPLSPGGQVIQSLDSTDR